MLLYLSLLSLAIALFYLAMKVADDVIRLATWLSACTCLMFSFVVAPWKVLFLFTALLLVSPVHSWQRQRSSPSGRSFPISQ